MSILRSLTKPIVIVFSTLCLLALFNANRPPLPTETEAAFVSWYQSTSSVLQKSTEPPHRLPPISARFKVFDQSITQESANWIVPSSSDDPESQRDKLARVLQLINESRVFSGRRHLAPPKTTPFVSVTVIDDAQKFEAYFPMTELSENIKLQNLMKLIEVFNSSDGNQSPAINPTQL